MKATQTYTAVVTITVEYNSDGGTSEPQIDRVANAAEDSITVDIDNSNSDHQPDDDSEIVGVSIDWNTVKMGA